MSGKPIILFLLILFISHIPLSSATVTLNGKSMTPQLMVRIASGEPIAIDAAAMQQVNRAHQLLINAAQNGLKIYGLTVGVGLNKDRPMVDVNGKLTDDVINASKKFNTGLLHAHAGGIGRPMTIRVARATMAARLNSLLTGGSGVQPQIIDAYVNFLNKGITPVIPEQGSIGEGDITVISHIGLAMLGEGDVFYQGQRISAQTALQRTATPVIQPFAKDALSILSSNAFSAAIAALALNDMAHFLEVNTLSYTLSLQALNGNVSPFLAHTLALRPYPEVVAMGKKLRELLKDSSLWQHDQQRPLQDPLSFRSGVYLLAELQQSYQQAYDQLYIQLNSSDDNPGVITGVTAPGSRPQESAGYVMDGNLSGAVLPTANFEPLPLVLALEKLSLALAHNSLATAQQVVKLNNPAFTGLSRYLGTEHTVHAFGAMEKPVMALAMENKSLAMPVSLDYLPVAGGIEDIATGAPVVARRLQQQLDNSYQLLGLLLVHSAQAVDLRQRSDSQFRLAAPANALYTRLRQQIPFMETDRPLDKDFAHAEHIARQFSAGQ